MAGLAVVICSVAVRNAHTSRRLSLVSRPLPVCFCLTSVVRGQWSVRLAALRQLYLVRPGHALALLDVTRQVVRWLKRVHTRFAPL